MFISELFESQTKQTLVIIPGGFHPFHPGHLSLYQSAQRAFPGATIIYAATDDKKERPFAFSDKQKLAQIAGVPAGAFQLVKSPFVAKEITQNFDPNTTVLIFARSEKDRDEQPKPGGIKKDGSLAYLQPYNPKHVAPMSQHGYMAYLPTVQFDAGPSGVTSATQIRDMWPKADDSQKNAIIQDLYPKNPAVAKQILDHYLSGGLAEGDPETATRGDPHPEREFWFPVKGEFTSKLSTTGKKKTAKDKDISVYEQSKTARV
jgi:glycerol-3-phosphate cytidylyltransferase-like family protein